MLYVDVFFREQFIVCRFCSDMSVNLCVKVGKVQHEIPEVMEDESGH